MESSKSRLQVGTNFFRILYLMEGEHVKAKLWKYFYEKLSITYIVGPYLKI